MAMPLTRRYFLKSSGIAAAAFASQPLFLTRTAAASQASSFKRRPVLIALFQRGAADGLSMAPPFGDALYYKSRPQIAIPPPLAGGKECAIDLDGFYGLHPALGVLKPLYDSGHFAVVQAVGSPSSTRSHFDAQDYMEAGAPDVKSTRDGWLNRCLQARLSSPSSPFRAVAFSPFMPRTLAGSAQALAMRRIEDFDVPADLTDLLTSDAAEALRVLKGANPLQYSPDNGARYPVSQFGSALRQIAQLIKADIGLEIAFADIGGWDTHANQGGVQGQLAQRLSEFGQGIAAFHKDMGDRMEDVVLLTMTEFGRSLQQNGSGGTDHGHASALFVSGGPVKGGRVYGKWPGLSAEQLFERRDLAVTTDFRDVFSEVVTKHLNITNTSNVFPNYKQQQRLGLV
jgi:uncharacterized protein (DUF1501 family)